MKMTTHVFASLTLVGALSLASCKKDNNPGNNPNAPDIEFVLLDNGNKLVRFNAKSTRMPLSTTSVTGLDQGENLIAIDYRPATGQLYALSSTSRILVIDEASGAAWALTDEPFNPGLAGTMAGFDFNPTVDRIRIVTNTGQNLRAHPETGAIAATDGSLNGVSNAMVTAVAYTNSKAGASSTTLFDIDTQTDMLYKQDPPNDGGLVAVGSLGQDLTGEVGFDINPDNSVALAVAGESNSSLFTIDINTGRATKLGELSGVTKALGIAIPTEPVAYAISGGSNLLIFNPENPMPVTKAITGLAGGETVMGIDFRPATGGLYALGSSSRLYLLNTSSGAATAVGTQAFSTALNGTSFGFDFNPTVDRIRVVSNTGQNLRLNPNDGVLAATDGMLNPNTPKISGAAYTNNNPMATTTTLFDLDYEGNKLFKQDPPNDGGLVEIGDLGVNIEATNGFDIGGTSGKAWAILTVGGNTKLYEINLTSGRATPIGDYNFSGIIDGFAVGLGF